MESQLLNYSLEERLTHFEERIWGQSWNNKDWLKEVDRSLMKADNKKTAAVRSSLAN